MSEDETNEDEGAEDLDLVADDVFAELTAQAVDGGVHVNVWSRGQTPLPGRWVRLSVALSPASGEWSQDLAVPALGNDVSIAPGDVHTVTVPVEGYGDASYRLDVKLWVRDDSDRDVSFAETAVYLTVVGGRAGAYRDDPIADAELGEEFEELAGDAGGVHLDPLPYLSGQELVVTFVADGPGTVPAGTSFGIHFHQHASGHTDHVPTDRDVPAGHSYSRTIALPALEQGNHAVSVSVGTTTEFVTVCYQDGPVEVLY